jgi:CRP-like cAMP-binding protein
MNDNQLTALPFFQPLTEQTRQTLWQNGHVRHLVRRRLLFQAGNLIQTLYFQLTGKSCIYTVTPSGQRKIHFVCGRGELLNQNTLNPSVSASYCEMLEDSTIFAVPSEVVARCMRTDFELVRSVVGAQERKLWRLEHQLKNTVSSMYMERKLAAKLWKLSRDFGVQKKEGIEIDMDLSVSFLADMLGVPRETTSRLRSTLIRSGIISVKGRRITVIDPDAVAKIYHDGVLPDKK